MSEPDLDIIVADARWDAVSLEAVAHRAVTATLAHLGLDAAEVSILGTDDTEIARLNGEFRDKPAPTNVLSWPAQDVTPPDMPQTDFDGTVALGDIALAYDTCAREAADSEKPLADHVTHLIVHGVLHLLGYDHLRDQDATLMEGIEVEILGKLGLDDPYT